MTDVPSAKARQRIKLYYQDKAKAELDELDREYYRSKLELLSWCLPVVRAALKVANTTGMQQRDALEVLYEVAEQYEKEAKP